MKLTLDIDTSETFAGDLKELLASLSDEQKARIAEHLVVQVLSDMDARTNKQRGIERALAEMNEKRAPQDRLLWNAERGLYSANRYSYYGGDNSTFQALVKKHADVYSYFNDFLFDEITKLASEEVEARIKESKQVNELVKKAVEVAEQNLPKIVTSALTAVLVQNIRDGLNRADAALMEHDTLKDTVEQMQSRLLPE